MFNVKKVPYGVQYEIARYVNLGRLAFGEVLIEWLDMFSSLKTNYDVIDYLNHVMRPLLGTSESELMDTDGAQFLFYTVIKLTLRTRHVEETLRKRAFC